MDRCIAASRLEELTQRMRRLQNLAARRVEQGHSNVEALLLETVDVTTNLVELTTELLQGQVELARHIDTHNYAYGEDCDSDEMFMMCPYCHENIRLSKNELDLQLALCPHCSARMSLYSPS